MRKVYLPYSSQIRVKTIAAVLMISILGCQPPTDTLFDAVSGTVSGIGDKSLKIISTPSYQSIDLTITTSFNYIYDSSTVITDGSYLLPEGFPVAVTYESNIGCSNQENEIMSENNEPFILSFIHNERDTLSVLVIDTTGYGVIQFEIDSTEINSVIMGSNDVFGDTGTERNLPDIDLSGWITS